jgi:hypothetical protein
MYPATSHVFRTASEKLGGVLVLAATRRRRRWSGWWAAFPWRFGPANIDAALDATLRSEHSHLNLV